MEFLYINQSVQYRLIHVDKFQPKTTTNPTYDQIMYEV